jgi:putative N6-adenine-specific DNA methylase
MSGNRDTYEYQKTGRYFAQAPGMMEELCREELVELGAREATAVYRGVTFAADARTLYAINYASRLLTRVLAPLAQFPARTPDMILEAARRVRWERFLDLEQTFAISATVAHSEITHSLYAAQCLKDGIADHFRAIRRGRRPSVDTVRPDVRFHLHIDRNRAVLSLDTSGDSLHKRGYRLQAGEAPMQETLAAAIVRLAGWDGETVFWDCMCGSGTLACEALMQYCRIPAQYLRERFGFFALPDFDRALWESVKAEHDARMRPLPAGLIRASDISPRAVETARGNLARLPFADAVELACMPFQQVERFADGTIVANPPYGMRLGSPEEARALYTELGDFIKQRCTGSTCYIYTGDPALRKAVGLRTSRRVPLVNGKLEGVLLRFDSYEGSRKPYYAAYRQDAGRQTGD